MNRYEIKISEFVYRIQKKEISVIYLDYYFKNKWLSYSNSTARRGQDMPYLEVLQPAWNEEDCECHLKSCSIFVDIRKKTYYSFEL